MSNLLHTLKSCLWMVSLPLLLFSGTIIQAQSIPACERLEVKYTSIVSNFRWMNEDELVFSVSPGIVPTDSLFYTNEVIWYKYQPTHKILSVLERSPYDTSSSKMSIPGLEPGKNGVYENVRTSPSGNKIVYPKNVKNHVSYWLKDNQTGVESDLKVDAFLYSPDVFWLPQENSFIIQNGSNLANPIMLVSITRPGVVETPLATIKPFSDYQPGIRDFRVVGVSLSGRYLLTQPLTPGAWLYDFSTESLVTLDFFIYGNQQVVWVGKETFIALTDKGVIRYDLSAKKMDVLVSPKDIGLETLWGGGTLSPDGHFLAVYRVGSNGAMDAQIEVCTVHSP